MNTNILKSMAIHFETLQVNMKKEETKNDYGYMLLQQRGNKNICVEGAHHELNLGHRYGNYLELPLDHSAMGVHSHTHIFAKSLLPFVSTLDLFYHWVHIH
jgi:hypothetical protein